MKTVTFLRCRKALNCSATAFALALTQFACSTNNDASLVYNTSPDNHLGAPKEPNNSSLAPENPSNPSSWLSNGGVESGVLPWVGQGSATVSQSTDVARSGSYSLLVEGRTVEWHGPVMPLNRRLPSGQTYHAEIWVRLPDGAEATPVALVLKSQEKGQEAQYKNLAEATATAEGWVKLLGNFTHNPNGELEALELYVQSSDVTARFYVDDLKLETYSSIITNGGLEDGLEPWTYQGSGVAISRVNDVKHSGDYSLYVSGRNADWHGPVMRLPELAKDRTYLMSVYAYLPPGSATTNMAVTFKLTLPNESQPQYRSVARVDNVEAGTWVQLAGSYQHSADATIELYIEASNPSASFYVDDLDVAVSRNVLVNGSFEGNLSGWWKMGNATLTATQQDAYAGSYSLLVSGREAEWNGAATNLALEAGELYTLECRVRLVAGTVDTAARITMKMDDGTEDGGSFIPVANMGVTSELWTRVFGDYLHDPQGDVTELFMYVHAEDPAAEFMVDACAVNTN